jgi:hypothetical protein
MSLEYRSWLVLAIAVLPVPLPAAFFIGHNIATGTASDAYGLPMAYLLYGLANLVTVSGLYVLLSPDVLVTVQGGAFVHPRRVCGVLPPRLTQLPMAMSSTLGGQDVSVGGRRQLETQRYCSATCLGVLDCQFTAERFRDPHGNPESHPAPVFDLGYPVR